MQTLTHKASGGRANSNVRNVNNKQLSLTKDVRRQLIGIHNHLFNMIDQYIAESQEHIKRGANEYVDEQLSIATRAEDLQLDTGPQSAEYPLDC